MTTKRKPKLARKASPFDEFFDEPDPDPRPFWRRYDADEGLTLRDASIFYGDDHTAETVWTLEREGYQDLQNCDEDGWPTEPKELAKRNRLELNQRRLQDDLTWKLRRGELYATGFVASASADMPATRIHTSRWAHLVPDFETSSATGLGQTIYGVLVFDGRKKVKDPPSKHAYSAQRLREWYQGWVSANSATGATPSRDQDWSAARGQFGNGVPRDAVRALRRELAPPEWTKLGRRKAG